jgi:hypothetical protein
MKNNLEYFTHYTDAPSNGKFILLIASYPDREKGLAMEARFWRLNCLIGSAPDARLDLSVPKSRAEALAATMLTIVELNEFVDLLASDDIRLIHKDGAVVWTEQTQDDLGRVMASRKDGRERYKKSTSDEKVKTSDEKNESLDEAGYRAEQSKAKQINIAKQQQAALVDNSEEEVIEALGTSAKHEEIQAVKTRLDNNGLDVGFVTYCRDRVTEERKTKDIKYPRAFLRKSILEYDDWIDDYRETLSRISREAEAEKIRKARASPPSPCPKCGGETRAIDDRCQCVMCKTIWEFDDNMLSWDEDVNL